MNTDKRKLKTEIQKISVFICVHLWLILLCAACGGIQMRELQKPVSPTFYGNVAPPPRNEFRWSNGVLPKTFDPIQVNSPSEQAVARHVFEGLTDLDAPTLQPVPAIAARWDASEDWRNYTFYLRPNAVWTNGKKVTAKDFVNSWQRLADDDDSPNRSLINNIVGAKAEVSSSTGTNIAAPSTEIPKTKDDGQRTTNESKIQNPKSKIQKWFGAEAVNDTTLRVFLVEPDKDFARLTAHPALRPVFADDDGFDKPENFAKIVTNGAFRIANFDKSGVTLERSKNYWNAASVKLERARIVATANADAALAAYEAGDLDAVTNQFFEPLALKLLTSYKDFDRAKFNAVTFYEFNRSRAPFDDRRIREAFIAAVDRDRLTNDEMDGASVPAVDFLPASPNQIFKFDLDRARKLLTEAGFANGKNFPKIRLYVNQADLPKRVAKAIAAQWRKNLNVECEIVTGTTEELNAARVNQDFDLLRRVVVLPTTDESASFAQMFPTSEKPSKPIEHIAPSPTNSPEEIAPPAPSSRLPQNENQPSQPISENDKTTAQILSEADAMRELPAVPLYFSLSNRLVKPYVKNFDHNLLDAPTLKNIEIETDWQTPTP